MSKRVIPNLQFNINGEGEPDYSVIGENEIKNQELIVKNFDEGKEVKITNSKIIEFLQQNQ